MKKENIIPAAKRLISRNKQLLQPSRWKKLSTEDKRKAVLLDAMKSILNKVYVPSSRYTDFDLAYKASRSIKTQLQDVLPEYEKCEVCQRGMLLLSCVRFNNNVTIGDYRQFYSAEDKSGLSDLVNEAERLEMEIAFEGSSKEISERKFNNKYRGKWNENYGYDRTVLSIAIFLNAYKYGRFSPGLWVQKINV